MINQREGEKIFAVYNTRYHYTAIVDEYEQISSVWFN